VPKIIILVTNFQKSPSAGGSPPPAPINLRFWWPEVTWFGKIVVCQANYNKSELKKISCDVIFVTSSPLSHRNIVTKVTSQNFSILCLHPNLNFWLRQWFSKNLSKKMTAYYHLNK